MLFHALSTLYERKRERGVRQRSSRIVGNFEAQDLNRSSHTHMRHQQSLVGQVVADLDFELSISMLPCSHKNRAIDSDAGAWWVAMTGKGHFTSNEMYSAKTTEHV